MDFFDYVAQNNSEEALSIFRDYSRLRVRNPQELADGLRAVMKNLRAEEKQDFMTQLATIHPDREMLTEISTPEVSDPDDNYDVHKCNCPYCQMKNVPQAFFSANGQSAVSHFMNTGGVATNTETTALQTELQNIKQENQTKKLLNDKLFQMITLAVLGFLVYKFAIKK